MSQDKNVVYAAAQGRSWLRGELSEKSNDWVRKFAGMVDDPETLDLLNYYCGLWADEDGDFLDTAMAEIILSNTATTMLDGAFRAGNVSQLQGAVGLTDNSGDAGDALNEIVNRLSNEGTIAILTGPPGSGKTSTLVDVNRAWGAKTGGALFGNVAWNGFDRVVRSDMEMLEAMANVEGPTLGNIDESMQELTGRGADSEKAEVFADRSSLIRKEDEEHGPHAKRGSLLLVSHIWGRTNKPTREMATLVIQKPSANDPGKVVLWESEGGEDSREKIGTYTGLTDTRENYPEHEASTFSVILDDEEEVDDGPTPEEIKRRERIRSYLLDCKPWADDGMSQQDAARKQGYKSSWATDRKREWERGEWNDLEGVPEPSEDETA